MTKVCIVKAMVFPAVMYRCENWAINKAKHERREAEEKIRILPYMGVGNSNPLQYSCLENPKDKGSWWATVHRVTKSWTQLK